MTDALQEQRTAIALAALAEVTDPAEVGALVAVERPEPGVVDLRFACTLAAYAGWSWVVSTADLPDQETTVLEVELLPGDDALLAPPWVPWTERLAEWRRVHPDEQHPGEEPDDADAEVDADDADADDELDEDDLAVDDELDELDETELDGAARPAEDLGSADEHPDEDEDDADLDDDLDDDGVPITRPADEDRSI